jgi:hypothetical protein
MIDSWDWQRMSKQRSAWHVLAGRYFFRRMSGFLAGGHARGGTAYTNQRTDLHRLAAKTDLEVPPIIPSSVFRMDEVRTFMK